MNSLYTIKYEVVIGVPDDEFVNCRRESQVDKMIAKWQEAAKNYYEKTEVYVSAIVNEGKAIYNKDWGCPDGGERTLTFNCTANTNFIKDLELYETGIHYIAGILKKYFNQSTITITKIKSNIQYITDEDNDSIECLIEDIEGGYK